MTDTLASVGGGQSMRPLLATLTLLAACLLIVLITGRIASIPASWYWVGVAA